MYKYIVTWCIWITTIYTDGTKFKDEDCGYIRLFNDRDSAKMFYSIKVKNTIDFENTRIDSIK